jgi:hypothetical protein
VRSALAAADDERWSAYHADDEPTELFEFQREMFRGKALELEPKIKAFGQLSGNAD